MAKDKENLEDEEEVVVHRNHLISRRRVHEFIASHPQSKRDAGILLNWCKSVEGADWETFADVVETMKDVQKIGRYYVTNVHGNFYRFVYTIRFRTDAVSTVFLKFVLTHKEYDRLDLK